MTMPKTRAEHRARAELLVHRYETSRVDDPKPMLLAAIAHGVLSLGPDDVESGTPVAGWCANADPFPAGLPQPTT